MRFSPTPRPRTPPRPAASTRPWTTPGSVWPPGGVSSRWWRRRPRTRCDGPLGPSAAAAPAPGLPRPTRPARPYSGLGQYRGFESRPSSSERLANSRRSPGGSPDEGRGAPGSFGSMLALVADPDEVVEHRPDRCQSAACGADLAGARENAWQRRQVRELPEPSGLSPSIRSWRWPARNALLHQLVIEGLRTFREPRRSGRGRPPACRSLAGVDVVSRGVDPPYWYRPACRNGLRRWEPRFAAQCPGVGRHRDRREPRPRRSASPLLTWPYRRTSCRLVLAMVRSPRATPGHMPKPRLAPIE